MVFCIPSLSFASCTANTGTSWKDSDFVELIGRLHSANIFQLHELIMILKSLTMRHRKRPAQSMNIHLYSGGLGMIRKLIVVAMTLQTSSTFAQSSPNTVTEGGCVACALKSPQPNTVLSKNEPTLLELMKAFEDEKGKELSGTHFATVHVGGGTGFLVRNKEDASKCYIMTALHVVEPQIRKDRDFIQNLPKKSIVGKQIDFSTQELPNGETIRGTAKVIFHGNYRKQSLLSEYPKEDIALLEDPYCLSKRKEIGSFYPVPRQTISGQTEIGEAVYIDHFPVSEGGEPSSTPMALDKCKETKETLKGLAVTNCPIAPGSSGGPIYTRSIDGRNDPNRRPVYGIAIGGDPEKFKTKDYYSVFLTFETIFERHPELRQLIQEDPKTWTANLQRASNGGFSGSN